ncbi:MAG: ATP-dependent 6-phosphofructokinase [Myxococcota bacterium]|nr:ATP-dependent 6-phosphofructokinase [Myxococcota bacterium]
MSSRRIGILTGGGDAPGLNAVIRAVVRHGGGQLGWEIYGVEDSFNGLMETPCRVRELNVQNVTGILPRGGTILGTTNKGDPFAYGPDKVDLSERVAKSVEALSLEGLVVIGGDGTQALGLRLMEERGVNVVGVPKTIDNDIDATDYTFGFQSAVSVATEALDRLHTTAESHARVMVLQVMGRDAGHIALHAGLAGGAHCIVLPEIPYDIDRICQKIERRRALGKLYTLIVVADSARAIGKDPESYQEVYGKGLVRAGGPGPTLAHQLAERMEIDIRVTVLGHLQRGGSPIPFDRILATRLGVEVVGLIEEARWGEIVVLQNQEIVGIPIRESIACYRGVDPDGQMVKTARAVGIEFGG